MTVDDSRLPDLGPRGEGWVAAQVVLIAGMGLAGILAFGRSGSLAPWGGVALVVGGIVLVAGVGVVGLALARLGSSFSPFPRPVTAGVLVESGIYGRIRHPMYVGVVASGAGWGVVTGSVVALGLAIVLALLFDAKARREEAWLSARYSAYRAYRARTRRFIPGVY